MATKNSKINDKTHIQIGQVITITLLESVIKVFRVRVGDYRILYFVDYSSSKVYIEKIDKRGRVYD